MLTSDEQAHLEGAKNLWRYSHRDVFNFAIWGAIVIGVIVLCALGVHLIDHLPGAQQWNPCGTANPNCGTVVTHPLHAKPLPGFPQFQSPPLGNS